ncbi:hypothetical protein ACIQU6_39960 [Streptomyces sp. NPDC090442]|uniref:hypothetical protein n=1 Tax=Streptomyces sp. NPDC090442 TaxID=3365962 RepID=UPI0037FB64EC
MPQRAQNTLICRGCDDFARVAITTGQRHRDGSRKTVTVTCPLCKGTGRTIRATDLIHIGK